ncbi:MAG: DUF4407 domain-containing protein [Flavobacteriales bacterium]|nr:DUF4407 domain-containing protein [Flavobacteriales bacterium]
MLRFYSLLTADPYDQLIKHGPVSRKKVAIMGMSLLLVAGMWTLIGAALFRVVAEWPWPYCIGAGFLAGLVVFSVDRMILLQSGKHWAPITIRAILSLITATLGSVGIDLLVLHKEIDQTLVVVHQEEQADLKARVQVEHNKAWTDAQQAVARTQQALHAAEQDWKAELEGSGGTQRYGAGPVARAKRQLVNQRQRDLATAQDQLARLQADIGQQQGAQLASLAAAQQGNGLFERIHALHRYVMADGFVQTGYILLFLFFFLVEVFPLIAKYGGRKTSYELEIETVDHLQQAHTRSVRTQRDKHDARVTAMSAEELRARTRLQDIQRAYRSPDQRQPHTTKAA